MTVPDIESVHPKTALAWRKWLEQHHTRGQGVWLISYKQATGKPRIAYEEAVATALCFGWIDSKPRALDAERSMLWFAPRKKTQCLEQKQQRTGGTTDARKPDARVRPGKNRRG